MARKRNLYALAAGAGVSLILSGPILAQPPSGGPNGGGRPNRPFRQNAERWRKMSPEDRQRFQSNMQRWRQMPPEERKELRLREVKRRQRLQQEAEAAIRESGLQLEAEKRKQYELRYIQERKRIEQALRQEIQERRQRELAPVVERLKKEFDQPQGSGGSAGNAAPGSPSPRK